MTRSRLHLWSVGFVMLVGAAVLFVPVGRAEEGGGDAGTSRRIRHILQSWFVGETLKGPIEIEGAPVFLDEEGTAAISQEDLLTENELRLARPWMTPDYSSQGSALGWSPEVFNVPDSMRDRVRFWREIYTRYTTNQGIIHDNVYLNVMYAAVDFSEIMKDSTKTPRQKARMREQLVQDKKDEIITRLMNLHGRKSSAGLSGEDLRVWRMFESINSPDKFREAAQGRRVRFQLGQKDKFIIGIFQSGRYLRQMEEIFRKEGLPIELTRLPFVESSFNLKATSRVGASGIWQFMPRTGRAFMKVGRDIDERNDPIKSTRASARMLKQNYVMLHNWPLAVTGYNHGPFGVKKIVESAGTRDLSAIIGNYSSRTVGFASENFYACFLAALEVEREARRYFGDVKWGPEASDVEVKVSRTIHYAALLKFFDEDKASTELANPHLGIRVRRSKVSIPPGHFVRVPRGRESIMQDYQKGRLTGAKLTAALKGMPIEKPASVATPAPTPAPTPALTPPALVPAVLQPITE
jgi:membrane-bound lytic murein transglycosylase D